jgi:hypothetical protein
MTRELKTDERTLEAQTRTVRFVSLALAIAGFAAALFIASHGAA